MTIGIDARFLGSNTGFDRYLQGLLKMLETADFTNQYVVFVSKKGDNAYAPQNKNFKKIIIDCPWYGLKEQFLGWRFKREGAEMMHIPHWNAPLFMPIPFAVTIHDLILWQKPDIKGSHLPQWLFYFKYFIFKKIFTRAIKRSRAIMTPSIYTADELTTVFPECKNKIIVTGEAVKDFSRLPDNPAVLEKNNIAVPYLLYVGSAYPHKNLERLLETFALARARHPELSLILVGNQDDFYRDLKTWAAEKNFLAGVRFIDAVDDSALGTLYRHALLLLYPSLSEGYGLPPLEALSVGTRAVVSVRGSLPEVLGDSAIFCDPENVQDMLSKIELGLSSPKLMPYQAPNHSEIFIKKVLAAYDTVLKS